MAQVKVLAEIGGAVWKILVRAGDRVEDEQPVAILESMKMEIPVLATRKGTVVAVPVHEGQSVAEGQVVAVIEV